jgi:hypothetical protein
LRPRRSQSGDSDPPARHYKGRQWLSPPASGRMGQSCRRASRKGLRLAAMGPKPGGREVAAMREEGLWSR